MSIMAWDIGLLAYFSSRQFYFVANDLIDFDIAGFVS